MKRIRRWARLGLVSALLLLTGGVAVVSLASERVLRRTYAEPAVEITVPADPAAVVEGHRLALIRGCSQGCHGTEIEGGWFVDQFILARLVAPNLTVAIRRYSIPDLTRIIRRGVRPDGSSLVGMPSEMFSGLTDADLGKILAYLRSVPPRAGPGPERRFGPVARIAFVAGRLSPAAELVRRADRLSRSWPDSGSSARGGYLARTSCSECHGVDLRGGDPAPDLRIAATYSLEAFTRLLRTGRAIGERELPLMSLVARKRFRHFTDQELRDLYGYLISAASSPDGTRR